MPDPYASRPRQPAAAQGHRQRDYHQPPDRRNQQPYPGDYYPDGRPYPRPRRRRPWPAVLLGCALMLLVVVVIASLLSGGGPSATYRARVQDFVVINPADLAVTVRVTNTGKAAGTPQCTVQANDPSYAYTGTDVATLSGAIKPGAFAVYVDNVTITNQGAQYVTSATVSCQ